MKLPFRHHERATYASGMEPSHLPECWITTGLSLLPELAPCPACAGRLSRHRRAGPSASLDKSAVEGYLICVEDNTIGAGLRQLSGFIVLWSSQRYCWDGHPVFEAFGR